MYAKQHDRPISEQTMPKIIALTWLKLVSETERT